jgi:hypothetical protein
MDDGMMTDADVCFGELRLEVFDRWSVCGVSFEVNERRTETTFRKAGALSGVVVSRALYRGNHRDGIAIPAGVAASVNRGDATGIPAVQGNSRPIAPTTPWTPASIRITPPWRRRRPTGREIAHAVCRSHMPVTTGRLEITIELANRH